MLSFIFYTVVVIVVYHKCVNFYELLIERGWIEPSNEAKQKAQILEASKMMY